MRPSVEYAEQTKYLDEALHADARHERVSPPLLGSRIRNDMLRQFLDPKPTDLVVDLGCGSGRALLWNADWHATTVGIDISPFFAEEARAGVDLLLGDLRKLPFADGTFTRAYSLDVLEHLSPEALRGMLTEASRVLAPGGALFVYSHVRKNAPIAAGLRWINGLARQLERIGWIDMRQERLRKSDHLNPLRDVPELEQVAHDAGFRIAKIRFYTPIVGGFVENILMRVAERAMARRAARRLAGRVPPRGSRPRGHPRGADGRQAADCGEPDDLRDPAAAVGGHEAGPAPVRADYLGTVLCAAGEGHECGSSTPPSIRPCRARSAARSTSRRSPKGLRRSGTRSTCSSPPAPAARPVAPSAGSRCGRRSGAGSCAGRARRAVTRLAREIRPDAIIERYYNFGGEGILAGARAGAATMLEVNAPVVDHHGLAEAARRPRAGRRTDAAVARAHLQAGGRDRDAERGNPAARHAGGEDRRARVGRRHATASGRARAGRCRSPGRPGCWRSSRAPSAAGTAPPASWSR